MATSVVPALIDALVAQTQVALPNLLVLDGFGMPPGALDNTGTTGDFLMVGAESPDDNASLAATSEELPGPYGTTRPRDEIGEIILVALSWNGNKDQKAARDAVYATAAAVANLCRTSPSTALGVSGVLWTGYGSRSELAQNQTDLAAVAQLTFRVAFRARI